jgi:hypothetical protein
VSRRVRVSDMTLVHMNQAQFARLMAEARHGRFSVHD